jgi:hypothetical protein
MSAIFDAYNFQVSSLLEFYQRLNQPIEYPDGMTTTLGIIYWGRDEHLEKIENAIPRFKEYGLEKFNDVLNAAKTATRARKLSEQTSVPAAIIHILKHDIELWLPQAISLDQLAPLSRHTANLKAFVQAGLGFQLDVISAGQTPLQRADLSKQTGLDLLAVDELVKLCDIYRIGKNLGHIRSRIYFAMGLDSWQKWAEQSSDCIIAMFSEYIKGNHLDSERLIPWPKEVRNGIEWAKRHLEIFAVEW